MNVLMGDNVLIGTELVVSLVHSNRMRSLEAMPNRVLAMAKAKKRSPPLA